MATTSEPKCHQRFKNQRDASKVGLNRRSALENGRKQLQQFRQENRASSAYGGQASVGQGQPGRRPRLLSRYSYQRSAGHQPSFGGTRSVIIDEAGMGAGERCQPADGATCEEQLAEQLSRLEAERATMSERERLAAGPADMQSKMCVTNGDLMCTRAELEATRRHLGTTRRVREAAEREIARLKAQVMKQKKDAEAFEEEKRLLCSKMEELENQSDVSRTKTDSLRSGRAVEQVELRELHSKEAGYIRDRNGHPDGIEELNEVFAKLQEESAKATVELRARLTLARTEVANTQESEWAAVREADGAKYRAEVENLVSALTVARRDAEERKYSLEVERASVAAAREDLASAREKLNSANAELETARAEIVALSSVRDSLGARLSREIAAVEEAKASTEATAKEACEIAVESARKAAAEEFAATEAALREEMDVQREKSSKELQEALNVVYEAGTEARKAHEEKEAMVRELEAVRCRLEAAETAMRQGHEKRELEYSLEVERASVAAAREDLASAREKLNSANAEIETARAEIVSLSSVRDSLGARLSREIAAVEEAKASTEATAKEACEIAVESARKAAAEEFAATEAALREEMNVQREKSSKELQEALNVVNEAGMEARKAHEEKEAMVRELEAVRCRLEAAETAMRQGHEKRELEASEADGVIERLKGLLAASNAKAQSLAMELHENEKAGTTLRGRLLNAEEELYGVQAARKQEATARIKLEAELEAGKVREEAFMLAAEEANAELVRRDAERAEIWSRVEEAQDELHAARRVLCELSQQRPEGMVNDHLHYFSWIGTDAVKAELEVQAVSTMLHERVDRAEPEVEDLKANLRAGKDDVRRLRGQLEATGLSDSVMMSLLRGRDAGHWDILAV